MFLFNEHLKRIRLSHNITQKQLAEAIGASERGIQNYEMGVRKPTFEIILALSNYFDVPTDYLIGGRGANLSNSILKGANMREVKACGAAFTGADLTNADLSNADLRLADFSNAILQGANFDGAKLDGTIFIGANVLGTILEGKIVDGKYCE